MSLTGGHSNDHGCEVDPQFHTTHHGVDEPEEVPTRQNIITDVATALSA
jgi:hypothetical protein